MDFRSFLGNRMIQCSCKLVSVTACCIDRHVGGASSYGVASRSRVMRSSPWRRFCLTSEEGPPPAQGGKEILVDVLGRVPQIQEQIVAVVVPAVDVPVTMQLKFQQYLQYVFVKVPQIQFIVSLCEHSVLHRDCACCAEIVEFHRAVLGTVVDAPVAVLRQVPGGSDSAENRVGAAAAVHRRGVDPL